MDIRAGNYYCSMDQELVIYIEDQYSEGFLLSSLVIPTTRQPTKSFAEVSKLQVPFQQVVTTTRTLIYLTLDNILLYILELLNIIITSAEDT